MMKILVVGDGHSELHEVAVAEALKKLGHQVDVFYWNSYFKSRNFFIYQWLRIQNKLIKGPQIIKINRDLFTKAYLFMPDLIFIYRGTHIKASTILKLKKQLPYCKIVGYNNDDSFSHGHSPWLWKQFIRALPEYDMVFAYRKHNIHDFLSTGAKQVELLMPWFIPEKDHPIVNVNGENQFLYDVVFIGHYEQDHRLIYIKTLVESGINFRLYGPDWDRAPKSGWLAKLNPIMAVRGEDYIRTLCSARIALCFLSKLNRDTYTRRCFEIPATKTFMLCEFSEDIARLFREGKEADFFKTPDEMMKKIRIYLNDDYLRTTIAEAGFRRVYQDGHDVISRMKIVMDKIEKL